MRFEIVKRADGNRYNAFADAQKSAVNSALMGSIKNGRLTLDNVAKLGGYSSEAEMQRYKQENPNLYAVMGGVKYEPSVLAKNYTPLDSESKKIVQEAIKADDEIKNKYGSYKNYQNNLKDKMNEAYENYQEVKKHKDYTILERALNIIGGIDMGDKYAREEYIEAAQKYYATQNIDEESIKGRIKELNSFLDRPMGTVEERKEWKKELSHLNAVNGKVKDLSSYLEYGMASVDAGATKIFTGLSATADAIIGQPLNGALNLLGLKNNYIEESKATRDRINTSVDTRLVESAQTVGDKYVIAGNLVGAAIQTVPTVLMAYFTGGASLTASSASLATAATVATSSSAVAINSAKAMQTMKSLSQNPVYWMSFSMTYGTDYEQALEDSKNPVVATAYALTNSSLSAYVDAGSGVENLASTGRRIYSGNQKALRWWNAAYEEGGEGFIQKTTSEVLSRIMYKGEYKDQEEFVSFLKELGYDTTINAFAGGIAGLGQITFESIVNYKSANELGRLGEAVINSSNSVEVIIGLKDYFGKSLNNDLGETASNIDVNKPDAIQIGELYQVLCSDINTAINKQTNYADVKEGLRSVISQAGVDSKIIYGIALPQYFDAVSKLDVDINTAINDVYDIMIDIDANDSTKGTISQSEVVPFASKDGTIKATPHITEKDGMRIIDANKGIDEKAFVEGLWDDSPNSAKDVVENSQLESVENVGESGIINSGAISGARNPNGDKARVHAEKYYGLVRAMKTDVSKISKNSGFSEQKIQKVKNYVFNDKHDLGGEELEMFAPDFMMAESWKRLIEGNVQPHDLTLLLHEIMEMELVENGISQAKAHLIATKKYNYNKEAKEFYGKIKKYTD